MKRHVDTKHAPAAKLRSEDSDSQQFLAIIVVSEVEKKGVGALLKNDPKRGGGAVGARTTRVSVRGENKGTNLD